MKNKGFTLIELLAVIVILAIIALIATPIILGIINDARNEAKKRSAELAYSGVEYAITSYMYGHNGDVPEKVEDIANLFKAENVTMTKKAENNDEYVIKDSGNTELCTVKKETNKFTVDCSTVGVAAKTITLGSATE